MSYNHNQQYGSNPYSQAPAAEAGYGYANGGQQQEHHEMQPYGQPQYQQPAAPPVMTQNDFLAQVEYTRNEIHQLTADVQAIAALHQRALQGGDQSAQRQLEGQVHDTSVRTTSIRSSIKTLKADVEHTRDASRGLKDRQWHSLNDTFKRAVAGYMEEEKRYRDNYREQIARQYRIVNPGASEDEVRQAADANWGDEGVFQQALRQNRAAQGQAVLGAVRARHNELRQIEDSIVELAKMFEDLDTLVIQQAPVVEQVDQRAEETVQNLDHANTEVKKATDHAKNRRKLKWWCLAITILIILIAVAVGVGVAYANGLFNKPQQQQQ